MNYQPILNTINDSNFYEKIVNFIESWYEIKIFNNEIIDFEKIYKSKLSENINKTLNLFLNLNNSLFIGNKKTYTVFEYIFKNQSFKIGFTEKYNFLFLLQEGEQDFYYGVRKSDLLEENPFVYRYYKDSKTGQLKKVKDNRLSTFLFLLICSRASKIKTREYILWLKNNDKSKEKIKKLSSVFEYKFEFGKKTIFEKENALACIQNYSSKDIIITVNKWNEKDKIFTKEIKEIFGENAWSSNNYRFKL